MMTTPEVSEVHNDENNNTTDENGDVVEIVSVGERRDDLLKKFDQDQTKQGDDDVENSVEELRKQKLVRARSASITEQFEKDNDGISGEACVGVGEGKGGLDMEDGEELVSLRERTQNLMKCFTQDMEKKYKEEDALVSTEIGKSIP